MADVVATLIEDFVVGYMADQQLTAAELNTTRFPLLDLFKRNELFDVEQIKQGKQFPSHVVKQPVMNDGQIVIGNSFVMTVPDQPVVSAFENYIFTPYSFTITMFPETHASNQIDYASTFREKMRRSLEALGEIIELEKCYNLLETGKNQFWQPEVAAQFAGGQVGDALQVSRAEADNAYDKFRDILGFNHFRTSGIQVAASNFHRQFISNLGAQGNSNSINKQYKLDNYIFNIGTGVPQGGAANDATVFFMEQNAVGIGDWLPPVNTLQLATRGRETEYGVTENLPIIDMPMGYKYKSEDTSAADASLHSGTGGSGTTIRETFQFLIYITSKHFYNSDPATRFQPIVKAEFKST